MVLEEDAANGMTVRSADMPGLETANQLFSLTAWAEQNLYF